MVTTICIQFHHFLASKKGKKFGQHGSINFEHSPYKCTHLIWIGVRQYLFRYHHLSHLLAIRGPQVCQCRQRTNHFWTLTQHVFTTSFNTFQLIVENHHFDQFSVVFCAPWGRKLGQRRPKANQIWTLTQQMHIPNLKIIFQTIISGTPDRRRDAHPSYVPSRLRRRRQLIQQQA